VDDALVAASRDPDSQVRRLVMRAVAAGTAGPATETVLVGALADDSPIVRIEALRALRVRGGAAPCEASVAASADRDMHVALVALDQLAVCGTSADAVTMLEHEARDLSDAVVPRRWHRAAHALVALAAASPDRVDAPLRQMMTSGVWQLRMYAARAAAVIANRDLLEQLANDDDDNVREAAVEGLKKIAGHAADTVYVSQLTRHGYQVVRAAALALDGTPQGELAAPALKGAWDRLAAEGRDNSHDARDAIAKALASAGGQTGGQSRGQSQGQSQGQSRGQTPLNDLSAEELRRLASPRARITIRGVGTFELALFTVQAPATVMRFAHLAESGYYNGLTFHRVVPNFVIQGGSPGANEYIGDAMFMRDEVGSWPHVRGAVGISTRGRDTGDAQIFIDLVDNPRLDHEYTVFAQVLNGIDVVDRILEGDVIEKIEIIP
jgi:cyclophilin family peptidyl-prolyl cis-trans isomerase/HEAT repeat protein